MTNWKICNLGVANYSVIKWGNIMEYISLSKYASFFQGKQLLIENQSFKKNNLF